MKTLLILCLVLSGCDSYNDHWKCVDGVMYEKVSASTATYLAHKEMQCKEIK